MVSESNEFTIEEATQDFQSTFTKAMDIFPYDQPTGAQIEIIKRVLAIKEPGGIIIAATTGAGKTVATLTSLLARSNVHKHKILVFVRTVSQMDPIIREWSRIIGGYNGLKSPNVPRILPIKGKAKLCKQLPILSKYGKFSDAAIGKLCETINCPLWPKHPEFHETKPGRKPAQIVLEILNGKLAGIVENSNQSPIAGLDSLYQKLPTCGYYDQRTMMKQAQIIIVTYAHMRQPQLSLLLRHIGKEMHQILVLVDEAHNLAKKHEIVLTSDDIEKLAALLGPIGLLRKIQSVMQRSIRTTANEFAPTYEWTNAEQIAATSNEDTLMALGITKWDMMSPEITKFREFLSNRNQGFISASKNEIKIIEATPANKLAAFAEAGLLIFQSGTISPIQDYKAMFGLPYLEELDLMGVANHQKFRSYLQARGLTSKQTRRTPMLYQNMAKTVVELHGINPRHTLVICPSYDFKVQLYTQILNFIDPGLVVNEEPKSSTLELTRDIKYAKIGKIIIGVSGGKISEGIEVVRNSHSLISLVLMAGMSFRPPSSDKAVMKQEMLKATRNRISVERFQQKIPLIQDIEQAFGRSVRQPQDRGALVILDYRASQLQQELGLKRYTSVALIKNRLSEFYKMYPAISSI